MEEGPSGPRWLLFENVPFMLYLDRGRAMRLITDRLHDLGFTWVYRVINTRAYGLPHRRRRVILLASGSEDPRQVLLTDDPGHPPQTKEGGCVPRNSGQGSFQRRFGSKDLVSCA